MLQQSQPQREPTSEQRLFLSGEKIPVPLPQSKVQLAAWGVKFGVEISGSQPKLVAVTLPNKWTVIPSVVRSDQVHICDEKLALRATIDYRVSPNYGSSLVAINWEHPEATQRSVLSLSAT